jgi:hypothetical protein
MKAVIVTGSREWEDEDALFTALDEELPDIIIHGDCPTGADTMVAQYVDSFCMPNERSKLPRPQVIPMPAQWDKYDRRAAGPKRNEAMLYVLLEPLGSRLRGRRRRGAPAAGQRHAGHDAQGQGRGGTLAQGGEAPTKGLRNMKTQHEIVAQIRSGKALDEDDEDVFGFTTEVFIDFLDYEHAREFLKPDVTAEDWNKNTLALTEQNVRAEMAKYMAFAWGKVVDHRGISAGRSVLKMCAWLWILGDEETLSAVRAASYENYGAPKLLIICERLGFEVPDDDEDARRMARGLKCTRGDGCGCGEE